jgi:MFS family permease
MVFYSCFETTRTERNALIAWIYPHLAIKTLETADPEYYFYVCTLLDFCRHGTVAIHERSRRKLAFVFALGSIAFGFIIHRYEHTKMLYFAAQIYIVSLISIVLVTLLAGHNPLLITLAFIPFIIGQIIPSNILYPLCLNFMPQAKGRVSAILQGSRLIFSALGLQLAGYYYQGTFLNIGIIISVFIIMVIMTLFLVVKNPELMKFAP